SMKLAAVWRKQDPVRPDDAEPHPSVRGESHVRRGAWLSPARLARRSRQRPSGAGAGSLCGYVYVGVDDRSAAFRTPRDVEVRATLGGGEGARDLAPRDLKKRIDVQGPDPDRSLEVGGGQPGAVRAEGETSHACLIAGAREREQLLTRGDVVDPHRSSRTTDRQPGAVWAEGDAVDVAGWSGQRG